MPAVFRKTKIICTLGPATLSPEIQRQMILKGTNIFRLNMSHAPYDVCRQMVQQLRALAEEVRQDIGILMDLQGPTIRTGELSVPLILKEGDTVEITLPGVAATRLLSTSVNYPGLAADVKAGATMVIDNGSMLFQVISTDAERVVCSVLSGGELGSRRHINLPGTRVNLPGLTEKDHTCIALGKELGVDFIAMSFVRDAAHIRELRERLAAAECSAQIVAKIEDQSAVQHLDEIIAETDAVMVARGDLGMEVPVEELPIIQRRIVAKCQRAGKPVIVATHMLESMIVSPMPTRAEMTDVANAVFEEADAIMLSGETSVGQHPVRCIEMLDKIARRTECEEPDFPVGDRIPLHTPKHKLVRAAVQLADSLEGTRLVVFTQKGRMARRTAQFRPKGTPIFAFTSDLIVARHLHLCRGVLPIVLPLDAAQPQATVHAALSRLRRERWITAGQYVVIISDVLQGEFGADSVLLKQIEDSPLPVS
jgi:pyruvate kinase